MSIILDSYGTSMGSVYNTKPVVAAIHEAMIRDDSLKSVNLGVQETGGIKPVFITGFFDSETKIPLFTHPISIFNFKDNNYLCTDLRVFVKKGTNPFSDFTDGIRNITEFDFTKSRAVLNLIWIAEGTGKIKNDLMFAEIVYANWISQVIGRAFALDFKDQTIITILASVFYQGLFKAKVELSDDDIQRVSAHTMETTKAPSDLVVSILKRLEPMNDIHEFCDQIAKILENVRLTKFNAAILLNIISSSWYGQGSKEILAVCLEHPPTWCAMVYNALKQRTYKNSMVYQVAERMGKRGASDAFLYSYNMLVKQHLSLEAQGIPDIPDFD